MLSLQTICLGVLYSGPKSGYELHKTINTDLKYFQTASFGALYPALGKLEAKKFIASDGRDNPIQASSLPKKVYTITENGRAVFETRIQKTRAEEKLTSDSENTLAVSCVAAMAIGSLPTIDPISRPIIRLF